MKVYSFPSEVKTTFDFTPREIDPFDLLKDCIVFTSKEIERKVELLREAGFKKQAFRLLLDNADGIIYNLG